LPKDEPKGVIFDMDGVLIDSYRAHFDSWRRLAAENGRTYTEEQFVAGFGRTSREVLAEQWAGEPLDEPRIRELSDRKEAIFREEIARNVPAMEGAVELVHALYQAGFRLAVGSSGPAANVRLVIERLGIGPLLSATVTGDDVTRGKPDPQVFQIAAARMGVPGQRCIVVEDAPVGLQAAKAGGMRTVGLASTGRTREELAEADLVVSSLRELSPARLLELFNEEKRP
jgi:beta-phosphoglucomutase